MNDTNNNTWIEQKKSLEARINEGNPAPEDVSELPIEEIEVWGDVFQHRMTNQAASHKHVENLVKVLKTSKGAPLDPVSVFWVGDAWVLINGHHRLLAYQEVKYPHPIPVRIFRGSLDEALGDSLGDNAKDKLTMSSREKSEGAWRLVISTDLSLSKIQERASRSRQTVVDMRKIKKALEEKHPEIDLGEITWIDAQRIHKNQGERPVDPEWMDREVKIKADAMANVFGSYFSERPEILEKVLWVCYPRAMERILEGYEVNLESLRVEPEEFMDDF